MRSVTPAHAHVQDLVGHLERVGEGRALVGEPEQVLVRDDDQGVDILLQLGQAGLGQPHPVRTLEVKGLGHHRNGENALLTDRARDHRRRTGAGTATHAGGDEHHVAAGELVEDLVQRLLGRGTADLGPRPGAEPVRDRVAELDLAVGQSGGERLRVRVARDELDPLEMRGDHVVHGVAAGAADADDRDLRLELVRDGQTQVDRHLFCSPPQDGRPYWVRAMLPVGGKYPTMRFERAGQKFSLNHWPSRASRLESIDTWI